MATVEVEPQPEVDPDLMTDAEKVAMYERALFRIYGNYDIELAKDVLDIAGAWEDDLE